MLIKRVVLDRIAAGDIDLVFRRWKKPTVRPGGSLRTSVGMLDIQSIDRVSLRAITASEAHRAGYPTRKALLDELASREGNTYRITVRLGGTDPLITLRNRDRLSPDEVDEIDARLDAMDARSAGGPWTHAYLGLIADRPKVRAEDLASSVAVDKPTFKANVRKLKALGLTISHSPGYELSPRGRAYVRTRSP